MWMSEASAASALVDQQVDEPDDRRLEGHVAEVVDVLLGLAVAVAPVGAHALDDLLERVAAPVGALDGLQDGRRRRHAELDRQAEGLPEIVEEQRIGRIGGGDGDRGALDRDRAHDVLAQVLGREVLQDRQRRGQLVGREEGQPLLGGEGPQHVVRGAAPMATRASPSRRARAPRASAPPAGPPPRWRGHAPGSGQAAGDWEGWSPRCPDCLLHGDASSILASFNTCIDYVTVALDGRASPVPRRWRLECPTRDDTSR